MKMRVVSILIILILLVGCTRNSFYGVEKDSDNPVLQRVERQELPWQEAYAALLRDYAEWSDYLYFSLYDLDKDGTPELIVMGHKYYYGGELIDVVYTFRNDEVLFLDYDEDVEIVRFALGARTRILAAPGNTPGLIVYEVGPSAGTFGTSIKYYRMIIDGQRLVIDAYGERYVDVETLFELFNGFGYGIDNDTLNAAIQRHTHYYVNNSVVPERELNRVFELGDRISFSQITEDNIQDTVFAAPEASMNANEIDTYLLKNHRNPIIVEAGKYYRLYRDEYSNYLYMIFDKNENLVASDCFQRCPHIVVNDDRIISVSLQAGTGISTQWTFFTTWKEMRFQMFSIGCFNKKKTK
jgi:hypothetical protein